MAYCDADDVINALREAGEMIKHNRRARGMAADEPHSNGRDQVWELSGALAYTIGRISGDAPELSKALNDLVKLVRGF